MRYVLLLVGLLLLAPASADEATLILDRAYQKLHDYRSIPVEQNGYGDLEPLLAVEEGDIQGFRRHYPTLQRAVLKPHFSPPQNWDADPEGLDINYLSLYNIVRNSVASALAYEEAGDFDQALDSYRTGLLLGARLSGQGPLIYHMVSVALTDKAQGPLAKLLISGNLSRKQCQSTLDFLEEVPLFLEDFLDSSEMEFTYLHAQLKTGKASQKEFEDHSAVYFQVRPVLKAVEPSEVTPPASESEELADYRELFLNGDLRWRAHLTRHSSLQLLAAISLFKLDKGRPPQSLGELTPGYLPTLPRNYLSKGFHYKRVDDNFVLRTDIKPRGPLKATELQYYPAP